MLLAPTKDNSKLRSLPLPAPAEQTQSGEAAGEERESGGERNGLHRLGATDKPVKADCWPVRATREVIAPVLVGGHEASWLKGC